MKQPIYFRVCEDSHLGDYNGIVGTEAQIKKVLATQAIHHCEYCGDWRDFNTHIKPVHNVEVTGETADTIIQDYVNAKFPHENQTALYVYVVKSKAWVKIEKSQ